MKISATVLSILLRGSATTYASAFTLTKAPLSSSYTSVVPSTLAFSTSSLITNIRGGGSTKLNMSTNNAERPFNTWTFDKHCETMDWSPTPEASLTAVAASDSSIVVDDADLIIVGVFAPPKDEDADEDKEKDVDPIVLTGKAKEIDDKLAGALTDLAAENSKAFQNGGTAGSTTPVMRIVTSEGKAKRYMLLGLGAEDKEKDIESTTIMKLGDAVASACHDQKKVSSCNVILPSKIEGDSALKDVSTAFYSSLYADNRYRTGKKVEIKAEDVKTVQLIMEGGVSEEGAALAITTGLNLAKGCSLTKDIVNAPHNVLNSESLADTAKRIAKESGGSITCEILGKKECEKRGK